MINMSDKKTNINQTMLTALFLGVMLAGFGAVAYVSEIYKGQANVITLFESDTNTEFPSYDNDAIGYGNIDTCMRISPIEKQYNKTTVYTGNNTWVLAMNETTLNYVSGVIYIELPDIDNWILDTFILNMTENDDDSYYLRVSLMSFNLIDGLENTASTVITDLLIDYKSGGDTWNNETIDVSLSQAVEIHNNANNLDKTLIRIHYYDDGANYNAFAWEFSIKITGEQLTGWSIIDSLSTVLIIATVVNFTIAIYMTDGVDVGGYVKKLKKPKGGK